MSVDEILSFYFCFCFCFCVFFLGGEGGERGEGYVIILGTSYYLKVKFLLRKETLGPTSFRRLT